VKEPTEKGGKLITAHMGSDSRYLFGGFLFRIEINA
jgi:hypothetical protein